MLTTKSSLAKQSTLARVSQENNKNENKKCTCPMILPRHPAGKEKKKTRPVEL
jgi:hypothetical protein